MTISDPATYGKEVRNTLIENVAITYCSRVAGYFRGDGLIIRNSLVSDTGTEGIYVIGSSDVLLERNIIRRNNIRQLTGYYPSAVKIFNQTHRVTINVTSSPVCSCAALRSVRVAVGQKVDVARVVQNAGHVGGDKGLALAHADDHRRTEPGGNDLVRLEGREDAQRKGSGEPLDGAADGHFQRNRHAGGVGFLLHLLDQVGDDLGVGLGDELVALGGEFALQLQIILHNAVVDDDDAARAMFFFLYF